MDFEYRIPREILVPLKEDPESVYTKHDIAVVHIRLESRPAHEARFNKRQTGNIMICRCMSRFYCDLWGCINVGSRNPECFYRKGAACLLIG